MALLLKQLNPAISQYRDRRFHGGQEDFERALRESTTIYVGNLSFYTTEDQIYEARADPITLLLLLPQRRPPTPAGGVFVG